MRHNIRLTASALTAPARFRIWKSGSNPGDYGDLFYTERANASVMGEYELRGNRLLVDIEHATNPQRNPTLDPANPPPTAGYIALESVPSADGPELWAVPRWSDCGRPAPVPGEVCCGKHQIESGQRCYISPDWDIDVDTREPIRLNKVALVAEPATWGINLLASRKDGHEVQWVNEEVLRKKIQGLSTQEYDDQYTEFGPNYPPMAKFRDIYGKTFAQLRPATARTQTSSVDHGGPSVQSTTGPTRAGVTDTMDEMDQLRAGYDAAKKMAGSSDPAIAKSASDMCAAYESHAGALGLTLDKDGDADTVKPEASTEEPNNEVDLKQAAEMDPKPEKPPETASADPNKVDDTGKGPGAGPAVAGKTAARPRSATASAVAPAAPAQTTHVHVTASAPPKAPSAAEIVAQVKAEMAADAETNRLRNLVASRLPKGMQATVSTMGLSQLRTAARDLPAPPAAPTSDGGANVVAGKGGKKEESLSPVEQVKVGGWFRQLGLGARDGKRETITAARKAFELDPGGGETVVPDVFEHMEKARQKRRDIRAALVG